MDLRGRSKFAIIAFVAFSLVFLQAAAQSTTTTYSGQTCIITGQVTSPENCIASTIPYMSLGIMLSFLIIALVYMLGSAFEYRPIQGWYRAELWEAVKTAMLAGVIISSLVIMSAIANILAGTSYTQPLSGGNSTLTSNLASMYSADNGYISQQLNYSYQAYSSVLGISLGVNLLKSIQLSFWLPIPIPLPIPPFPIIGALQSGSSESLFTNNFVSAASSDSSSYSMTQELTQIVIEPVMIAFQFQKDLFYYIVAAGLGILIPIGLMFRAIPLVRSVGGTIIAFGIGAAIIYPALILLVNLPISNYIYTFTSAQSVNNNCPFASGLMCKAWNSITYLLGAIPGGVFPTNSSGSGISANGIYANIGPGLPVRIALGSSALQNTSVVNGYTNGFLTGFATPFTLGIYPTLNFILANMIGMILNFILFAIDLLFGLILVGGITGVLGGQVRLGIGRLSIR